MRAPTVPQYATPLSAVLLCALLCAALAGCGGQDPPAHRPSPVASSTPAVEPPPAAARANTKAGAIAFVRYYVRLINHAQATGDTKALSRHETGNCQSCRSVRAYLDRLYGHGGSIHGGSWAIVKVAAHKSTPAPGYSVDARIRTGPQTVNTGAKSRTNHGGRNKISVSVIRVDGGWKVSQWSRAH